MQMDREDHELLKRIKDGERVFAQKDGQPYEDFEREVLRLLRVRVGRHSAAGSWWQSFRRAINESRQPTAAESAPSRRP